MMCSKKTTSWLPRHKPKIPLCLLGLNVLCKCSLTFTCLAVHTFYTVSDKCNKLGCRPTCRQAGHPDVLTELQGHLDASNEPFIEGHSVACLMGIHLPGTALTQHSL